MGWWYDEKRGEEDQGIEFISIKEAVEVSLDDIKENEVCMLTFDIVESCHIVAGNMDKCFIVRAWSKEKGSPPLKGCKKAWVTHFLDEINIICSHM